MATIGSVQPTVYAHCITVNYRKSYNLDASSSLLLNYARLRQCPESTRRVSQSVAHMSLGLRDKIVLGKLDTKRDGNFADDCVGAMDSRSLLNSHCPKCQFAHSSISKKLEITKMSEVFRERTEAL